MQKSLVFLPGIMGSELRDPNGNKKVWPPKGLELITGYRNVERLLNPNLIATKSIRNVFVIAVYRTLLEDFESCGYVPGGIPRELIEFSYDWRLSNQITAEKLADRLDEIDEETEITLVGHSMGGLILRYLLESGEFNDRHWFRWIKGLITLGTPHKGAPEALRQVLGLEDKAKLSSAQVKKLTSDDRYPSAYQLTPKSGSSLTLSIGLKGELPKSIETFSNVTTSAKMSHFTG